MNQSAQAMNPLARCFIACTRWQGRTRRALRHSIKLRLVLVFLLLALAMAFTFIGGVQKAFSVGWREAARPLLMDYVDHLMADIAPGGTPDVAKATALTQRLHVMTVRIDGPVGSSSTVQEPRRGDCSTVSCSTASGARMPSGSTRVDTMGRATRCINSFGRMNSCLTYCRSISPMQVRGEKTWWRT